jgi:putative transposase
MARSLRIQYPYAFYHVTSRGNERNPVFLSQRDREKFLSYLESATERYEAVIHVYCLMDNHLLLDADEYAKELSRYIHLNPVRAGIVETPDAFEWSSFRYYTTGKEVPEWLCRKFILGYFEKRIDRAMKKYRNFVFKMIGQEYENPLNDIDNPVILGSQEFIRKVKEQFLGKQPLDRELPALRNLANKTSPEQIEEAVDLALASDKKLARPVKIYIYHRFSGLKLKEIAARFDIGISGGTQASYRIGVKAKKDIDV